MRARKKISKWILISGIGLAFCLGLGAGAAASAEGIPGDFDGNGFVNAQDIPLARKYLVGAYEAGFSIADANEDGKADVADLVWLKKKHYGTYPVSSTSDLTSVTAKQNTDVYDVTEVTEGNYQALQATFTGQWPKFTFQSEQLKDLAAFDYLTIRYKISYSASGGSVGIQGTTGNVYNGATSTKTEDGWTVATWRKDSTVGANIFPYVKEKGIVEICVYAWAGANDPSVTTTITVAEMIGGYDDVTSDGETAIDLTEEFGLTAEELTAAFTPAGGSAQEVSDVTSFVPEESGVLTLTVNKTGYYQTQIQLNVSVGDQTE